MWFTLAAAQGDQTAQKGQDFVTRSMSPDQIDEAQQLALEWVAKH